MLSFRLQKSRHDNVTGDLAPASDVSDGPCH